jgi:methylmalonyl-CoA/ethylmalonyl-CoA epimerase
MNKIEHIGIAVKSLSQAAGVYETLLGISHYKTELIESEGVNTMFFGIGGSKIDLLEPIDAENAVARFIEKRGEGVHHIAFDVDDIKSEMARLKRDGFTLLNEVPKRGADNKLVCFVHPKDTTGVLIELCQKIS